MHRHLIAITSAVIFTVSSACAAERYISLSAGAWMPARTSTFDSNLGVIDTSYSTGWGAAGAYGISFDNGARLENELAYRQATAKEGHGGICGA